MVYLECNMYPMKIIGDRILVSFDDHNWFFSTAPLVVVIILGKLHLSPHFHLNFTLHQLFPKVSSNLLHFMSIVNILVPSTYTSIKGCATSFHDKEVSVVGGEFGNIFLLYVANEYYSLVLNHHQFGPQSSHERKMW